MAICWFWNVPFLRGVLSWICWNFLLFASVPLGFGLCIQPVLSVGFCSVGICLVFSYCQTCFYPGYCHTVLKPIPLVIPVVLMVPSGSIVVPVEVPSIFIVLVSTIASKIWSLIVWRIVRQVVWVVSAIAGTPVKGSVEGSVRWSAFRSGAHCLYITVLKWIIQFVNLGLYFCGILLTVSTQCWIYKRFSVNFHCLFESIV